MFVKLFDLQPLVAKRAVLGEFLQALDLFQVTYPVIIAQGIANQPTQTGIVLQYKAPRSHAVGLVAELVRHDAIKVGHHAGFQQFAVQFGDAVDGTAAHRGQVGHAYVALAVFFNQRHPRNQAFIVGKQVAYFIQEAMIDFIDDFQVPR